MYQNKLQTNSIFLLNLHILMLLGDLTFVVKTHNRSLVFVNVATCANKQLFVPFVKTSAVKHCLWSGLVIGLVEHRLLQGEWWQEPWTLGLDFLDCDGFVGGWIHRASTRERI